VLGAALLSVPGMREPAEPPAPPPVARTAGLELAPLPSPDPGLQVDAAVVQPVPAEQAVPLPPSQAAAAPAPPRPASRPAPPPSPDLEKRAWAALDALDYPWRELGYDIRFEQHSGGGLLGVTDPASKQITVFVRNDQSDQSLRVTVAHEIAHALDFETGDRAQRAEYLRLRGVPADTPWFPCDGCSDFSSGAGDWAEVFALWLAGPGDFQSQVAGPPSDEGLRRIARLFAPPSARRAPAAPPPSAEPTPTPTPTKKPLLPIVP
jgi:hypothetical protein